jgi:hypothetical protein
MLKKTLCIKQTFLKCMLSKALPFKIATKLWTQLHRPKLRNHFFIYSHFAALLFVYSYWGTNTVSWMGTIEF